MKNILVTGGRGFIGFNALTSWSASHVGHSFVNVDAETYADKFLIDEKNRWLDENNIPRFVLDLGSDEAIESLGSIVETFDVDTMVLFGAESHVDNSIAGPKVFFGSNVIGAVNALEVARKHNLRVHYVSTDEVYGITYPNDETGDPLVSPIIPSSPYSSSKASADLVCRSYFKTYGLNVTVSRCSNNFGPWQAPEKLIPTILGKLESKEKIPVYGDGMQCRQWIYVDDHNEAIMDILQNGEPGGVYNISSNKFGYMRNIDIISIFAEMYGRKLEDVIEHVKDRPGHDTSYFIRNYRNLDYCETHIRDMLVKTCDWYRKNPGS